MDLFTMMDVEGIDTSENAAGELKLLEDRMRLVESLEGWKVIAYKEAEGYYAGCFLVKNNAWDPKSKEFQYLPGNYYRSLQQLSIWLDRKIPTSKKLFKRSSILYGMDCPLEERTEHMVQWAWKSKTEEDLFITWYKMQFPESLISSIY